MTRTAAGLLLLSLAGWLAPIAWSQPQPGFPTACTRPHPNYVCVRMWNQLTNTTVTFLIDGTARGSAETGQSVYATVPPGPHHVEGVVTSDPADNQRHSARTVDWAPGDNATYCIFETGRGGC